MGQRITNNNKIVIRVVLEGEMVRKFNIIKTRKGIKNNTELIRLLIAEEFVKTA